MRFTIQLYFDGGSLGNCSKGDRYGSYTLRKGSQVIAYENRFQLGKGTSNEAEWMSLIAGLDRLIVECSERGRDSRMVDLEIFTDSQTVLARLIERQSLVEPKKDSARRMWKLAVMVWSRLDELGSFKAEWNGRETNVAMFGH